MEEKIFFLPGDTVTLKQDLPNKPIMLVVQKELYSLRPKSKTEEKSPLKGIKCRWFTVDGLMQEAIFNTKDLIKI